MPCGVRGRCDDCRWPPPFVPTHRLPVHRVALTGSWPAWRGAGPIGGGSNRRCAPRYRLADPRRRHRRGAVRGRRAPSAPAAPITRDAGPPRTIAAISRSRGRADHRARGLWPGDGIMIPAAAARSAPPRPGCTAPTLGRLRPTEPVRLRRSTRFRRRGHAAPPRGWSSSRCQAHRRAGPSAAVDGDRAGRWRSCSGRGIGSAVAHLLSEERRERIRSEERAEMAAHLHDSVLQTLVLIQRRGRPAADGAASPGARSGSCGPGCTAARPEPPDGRAAARRVEALADARSRTTTTCRSRLVVVGDPRSTTRPSPASPPCREAAVNAARHAGGRPGLRVRRGRADGAHRVRPRRGARLRPRRRAAPTGAASRDSIVGRIQRRGGTVAAESTPRRGHRGRLSCARCRRVTGRDVRVFLVDDHALFRAGVRAELGATRATSSARPATSTPPSPGIRRHAGPTSCCSTCTCPAAAAGP